MMGTIKSYLNENSIAINLEGNTRALLTGERTALNFLMHLSGIATQAYNSQKLLEKDGVKVILDKPFLYDEMNNWSVSIETDMVEFLYGYTPRVAWIPERVWLSPSIYPDAGVADWLGNNFTQYGVEAVLLDDWPHLNGYSSRKRKC